MKRQAQSDSEEIEDESFCFLPPPKRHKTKTPEGDDRNDNGPWIEKYEPKTLSEICINPTKLKQVKERMEQMIGSRLRRILVLAGPSGSSKSTCVKILSQELKYGYIEYKSNERFDEFLNDCKYLVGKNTKYILIEELPNVFHKPTLQMFRDSLIEWVHIDQLLPPIIICLTEVERNFQESDRHDFFNIENNLNANTLLGTSFLRDLRVEVIKFNSIAKRFLTTTINKIVKQEVATFQGIEKSKIQGFINSTSEIGDIRSAINTLEIWARFHVLGLDLTDNFNRNTTINLFHAIGKIIYSSSKSRSLSLEESNNQTIDDILKNYDNLQLLNLSVLENYTGFLKDQDLDTCDFIANGLSESDMIYDLTEGKDLMIRNTRVGLENSSTSFSKITFSKNSKMMRSYNQVSRSIYSVKDSVFATSFDNINLIDGFFVPTILNKKLGKNYNRVGGKFSSIHIDDDMFEDDTEEREVYDDFQVINEGDIDSEDELSDPLEESGDEVSKNPFGSDYDFLDDSEFL